MRAKQVAADAYRQFMAEEPDAEEIKVVRCVAEPGKRTQPRSERTPGVAEPRGRKPGSLEELVCRVADKFSVEVGLLVSRRRDRDFVRARTEIARRAAAGAVAMLAAVAARLGRAPSTLSELLNRQVGSHGHPVTNSGDGPQPQHRHLLP